jgi:hypothetical protein
MSADNELDELRDPPIPDGSDPTIDPDTGTISHEERDEDGRIVRDRADHIPIDERVAEFTEEEEMLLAEARQSRTVKGVLTIGALLWLGK